MQEPSPVTLSHFAFLDPPAMHTVHHEGMSIVLSHITARTCLRVSPGIPILETAPSTSMPLKPKAFNPADVSRAREFLASHGVPQKDLATLHILVRSPSERCSAKGVVSHVWRYPIPPSGLLKIDSGIFMVSPEVCAQQLATALKETELIEYLFELCGAYALPLHDGDYTERKPLTTVDALRKHVCNAAGQRGANILKRVLPFVRDGARSPMETALCMLLILPRRLGGANLSRLKLAHRIDIVGAAKGLTRRTHVECDAYLPKAKTDFEYNGIIHETDKQAAIDTERVNALEAMGFNCMTITRYALFDQQSFERLMRGIARKAGMREDRLDDEFATRREALRQFVLRRHLGRANGLVAGEDAEIA